MAIYYLDTSPKQNLYKSSRKVNAKQLTKLEFIKLDSTSRIPLLPNSFPARRLVKQQSTHWVGYKYNSTSSRHQSHCLSQHRRPSISKSSLSSSPSNTSTSTNPSSVDLQSSFSLHLHPSIQGSSERLLTRPLTPPGPPSTQCTVATADMGYNPYTPPLPHPSNISLDNNFLHTEHQSTSPTSSNKTLQNFCSPELPLQPTSTASLLSPTASSTSDIDTCSSYHNHEDDLSASLLSLTLERDSSSESDLDMSSDDWLSSHGDHESDSTGSLYWSSTSADESSLQLYDIEDENIFHEDRIKRPSEKWKNLKEEFPYRNPLKTVGHPVIRARLSQLEILANNARRYERLPRSMYAKKRKIRKSRVLSGTFIRNSEGRFDLQPESIGWIDSTGTESSAMTKKQRVCTKRERRKQKKRIVQGKPYIRVTLCAFCRGNTIVRAHGCTKKRKKKRSKPSPSEQGKNQSISTRPSSTPPMSEECRPSSEKPLKTAPSSSAAGSSPCATNAISSTANKSFEDISSDKPNIQASVKSTSKIKQHETTSSAASAKDKDNPSSKNAKARTLVRPTSSKRDGYIVNFLTAGKTGSEPTSGHFGKLSEASSCKDKSTSETNDLETLSQEMNLLQLSEDYDEHVTNKNEKSTSSDSSAEDPSSIPNKEFLHSSTSSSKKIPRKSKRFRMKPILDRPLGSKVERPISLRLAANCVIRDAVRTKQRKERLEQLKLDKQAEAHYRPATAAAKECHAAFPKDNLNTRAHVTSSGRSLSQKGKTLLTNKSCPNIATLTKCKSFMDCSHDAKKETSVTSDNNTSPGKKVNKTMETTSTAEKGCRGGKGQFKTQKTTKFMAQHMSAIKEKSDGEMTVAASTPSITGRNNQGAAKKHSPRHKAGIPSIIITRSDSLDKTLVNRRAAKFQENSPNTLSPPVRSSVKKSKLGGTSTCSRNQSHLSPSAAPSTSPGNKDTARKTSTINRNNLQ